MHLESTVEQSVSIGGNFIVQLRKAETIWTESTYKFRCEEISMMARSSGFNCEVHWVDQEWPLAQSVFRAV
jgi:uncharacterized SAM-dependent methyltransferase